MDLKKAAIKLNEDKAEIARLKFEEV